MSFLCRRRYLLGLAIAAALFNLDGALGQQRTKQGALAAPARLDRAVRDNVERFLAEGMQTFRFDAFDGEEFWGGKVKLHQAIQGQEAAIHMNRMLPHQPRSDR